LEDLILTVKVAIASGFFKDNKTVSTCKRSFVIWKITKKTKINAFVGEMTSKFNNYSYKKVAISSI